MKTIIALILAAALPAAAQLPPHLQGKPIKAVAGTVTAKYGATLTISNSVTKVETVTEGGGLIKNPNGTIGRAPVRTTNKKVTRAVYYTLAGYPQAAAVRIGDRISTTGVEITPNVFQYVTNAPAATWK